MCLLKSSLPKKFKSNIQINKEKINNLTGKEAKHLNRYKGIKKNYLKMDKL